MFKTIVKSIYWVIFIPLSLIVLGLAYCEANKAYWDHRVKEMCEKDNGVTVFERASLTQNEYEALPKNSGFVSVPVKYLANENQVFYADEVTSVIKDSYPYVRRVDVSIKRKSDAATIAKYSSFHRVGGDIPLGFHPSSFSCPDAVETTKEVSKIFSIK